MAYTTTPVPVLLLFFFFIPLIIITVGGGARARTEKTANSSTSIIRLGSWLSPNTTTTTSWASSSGHFAFGFYQQHQRSSNNTGFAVGIWLVSPQNTTTTIVWTANRDDHSPLPSNSILNLTTHGLLLQNGKKSKLIHDSLSMPGVVASASMHDSGNFLLYDKHSNVVWESFDYPTDTILGGQNLPSDYNLVSSISKSDHSSGYFYLTMQDDGNLVAYPSNSQGRAEDAYWDSYADGALKVNLSLNVQGSLCIGGINDAYGGDYSRTYRQYGGDYSRTYRQTYRQYSRSSSSGYGPDSRPLPVPCFTSTDDRNNKSVAVLQHNTTSSSSTSTLIYRATLEVNGNFILYEHQFDEGNSNTTYKVLWQAMNDTSRIFAFCGFNSYWFGDAAVCQCFPGFIPAASNTKTSSSSTNILLKNCEQKMTMTTQ